MMSPAEVETVERPAAAARIGADLRAARERLGWSLDDVSASLRIRYPYLLAIEDGRIGDLPAATYAVGFVRAYAALLGLDQVEVARRFREEAGSVTRKTELEFPAPVPQRGVPAGAVVLLGVVLAIGGYVVWYHSSGDTPGQAVQQVPDRLAPLAETAGPPVSTPPSPAPTSGASSGTPQGLPSGAPGTAAAVAPAPAIPAVPPSSAAAAIPPPVAPAPVTPPGSPALASTSPPMPTVLPAGPNVGGLNAGAPNVGVPGLGGSGSGPDQGRILLRAHADTWVQVRDPNGGKVLLNRVLRPGDTWAVPPNPQLQLTTGNAGGLDLVVDGSVAPAVGGNGVVRRDLPLDPDLIKAGKLPAQIASGKSRPASPAPQLPGQGQTAAQ